MYHIYHIFKYILKVIKVDVTKSKSFKLKTMAKFFFFFFF
jgi:hypothetical protein